MSEKEVKVPKQPGETKLWHAIISFAGLIGVMAVGILYFKVDPHIPMFIGVIIAAIIALIIGYSWDDIERSMIDGISKAMQAIMILAIIGMLVGIWLVSGVVPSMIYYGLKILFPSIFLPAAVLICSITSLATGTSWGTMGTMGIALLGIAHGLDIPPAITAGAILSGAYFGDKMSPLSDTTNLAPAMAGTDVFTHVKFMAKPTLITYVIALIFFAVMGMRLASGDAGADVSQVKLISDGLSSSFHINPLLLLPPVVVIVSIALKVPAIPGIVLGIIAAAILGPIFQGTDACSMGSLMDCAKNGFVSKTGVETIDSLLSTGGLNNMMNSIALTLISMMFGGIMERTRQLEVVVSKLMRFANTPFKLIFLTEATCVASNATMPEQYISIVVPGRMYADAYKQMGLHAKTLSNALESAGTVTSALIPWNTCGVYILATLGLSASQYFPYAIFNWLMPIMTLALAIPGVTVAWQEGKGPQKKQKRKEIE